jgi:predicted Na+-dependent transporter
MGRLAVAALAVVSMPLSVAALAEYYGASATAAPHNLARQVFVAQLLPLGLGMLMRHFHARRAAWLEPKLRRFGGVLLVVLLGLALIDIWQVVVSAGLRVSLAIVTATVLALGAGHLLGGPDHHTDGVAISSAARNPSLALLVATSRGLAGDAAILAYFISRRSR